MNKKIISFLLAFSLSLSLVPSYAQSDDTQSFDFSELGSEYDLLKELGIVDGNTDVSDAFITRGEFAALAVRSLNMANVKATKTYFNDVPSSHSYYNEIGTLAGMGILNGTSEGKFSPDDKISTAHILCAALRMINMNFALSSATMQEIVSIASVNNLCGGISSGDYYAPAQRSDAYIIIYNTLHSPMYVTTSFGEDAGYIRDEDVSILGEYWKLKKASGLVTADYNTAITGERTLEENSLIVGNERFYSTTQTTTAMVGREIEFYYRDEGKTKTIVFAEAPYSKVVVLDASDMQFDYLAGKYTVYTNGKHMDFKIGDNYYLSYNGDPVIGSNRTLMDPAYGTVTLISNSNNIYSVVMVEEYYTMVLDYYDKYSETLVDISDETRNIKLSDYDKIDINKEVEKLNKLNVLNVYKSNSGKTLKIIVSDQTVSGKLVSLSQQNGNTVIHTKERQIALKGDIRFDTDIIEIGSFFTFYLDNYSNAVYAVSGSSKFGVILTYSDITGLTTRKCYVLLKDGTKETFELSPKINLRTPSGSSSYSSESIETYVPCHTLAIYDINSKGQIKEITLPMVLSTEEEYNNPPTYPFYRVDYFLKEWPTEVSGSNQYRREITGFGNWLILDKATVMQVPVTPGSNYTDENTTAFDISEFQDDYNITVNKNPTSTKQDGEIEVYQFANDGLTPSVLMIYGGPSNYDAPLRTDSLPHIVTKITTVSDAESGEPVTKLELLNSKGNIVTAPVKYEKIVGRDYLSTVKFSSGMPQISPQKNKIAVGDVVHISQRTGDGKIGRLALIYDRENDLLAYSNITSYNTIYRVVSGNVIASTDTFMSFESSNGRIERTTIGSASVIVVNNLPNGKTDISYGSRSDIKPGDKIVMYARYVNNNLVFVYKN